MVNFNYVVNQFTLRLLNKNNPEEVKKVQRLRYNDLLKEFNPSLPDDGLDDDGYDQFTDSIIIVDNNNNEIVGTYRLGYYSDKLDKFLMESEFNIDSLKVYKDKVLELGRAVVKKEYRDGTVISLLWSGLIEYALVFDYQYLLGTCSLHGNDPTVHSVTLSYLKKNYLSKFKMYAIKNSFELPDVEIDEKQAERDLPKLLKAYLRLGAKISQNGYIDYEFNSCDVITLVDIKEIDPRYVEFYTRKLK